MIAQCPKCNKVHDLNPLKNSCEYVTTKLPSSIYTTDWRGAPTDDGYYWFQPTGDLGVFVDDVEVGTLTYDAKDPQVVRVQGNSVYFTGSSVVLDRLLLNARYKRVK